MKLEREVHNKDLIEAISLKCSNLYGAMAFANALGGSKTTSWELCYKYPLYDLIAEAEDRRIDLSIVDTAVEVQPVMDSMYYKRAKGLVTESEFKELFNRWKNA